jgi:transposase
MPRRAPKTPTCRPYQRLAARRGKKRAIMAVAHAIVVSAFHMLSRQDPYQELGANYFDEHRREHLVDQLTRRIEHLVLQL